MGFVEQVSKDIDDVFFDEGFFGSKHSLDNKEITVIVDEDALEEIKKELAGRACKKARPSLCQRVRHRKKAVCRLSY